MGKIRKVGFNLVWVIAVLVVFVACIPVAVKMAFEKVKSKLRKQTVN